MKCAMCDRDAYAKIAIELPPRSRFVCDLCECCITRILCFMFPQDAQKVAKRTTYAGPN